MSCSCVAFSYVEKFTEFLRLFVSIHLRRFENNNMFPILEFLSLLFKYTFKQVIMCFRIVSYHDIVTVQSLVKSLMQFPQTTYVHAVEAVNMILVSDLDVKL